MERNKLLFYSKWIFLGLFCITVFFFFSFFYKFHLYFEEQLQAFLFTKEYFLSKMSLPGGFAGYLGSFFTQFYYLPYAGAVIITLLLLAIQQLTQSLLYKVKNNKLFFALSFLPALNCFMILCNEFYPLSGIIGFLGALAIANAYVSLKKYRGLAGILFTIISYYLFAGATFAYVLIVFVFEVIQYYKAKKREDVKNISWIYFVAILIVAVVLPLFIRRFFILEPVLQAYFSEFYYKITTVVPWAISILFVLVPVLMIVFYFLPEQIKWYKFILFTNMVVVAIMGYWGLKLWVMMDAEEIMAYDYLVRNGQWNEVIARAEKKPPQNSLALSLLNLSLAKTNQMPDKMFYFRQHGVDGLFIPSSKEGISTLIGNNVYYEIGLVNEAQHYAFESNETLPDHALSVIDLKRLAETNLINGQYEVSRKYLSILKKTLFYKKWAKETEKYLYNEQAINNQPEWSEKRRFIINHDFFIDYSNISKILEIMLYENPQNKMAFQYLMAYYLVNKDLKNFMSHLPLMKNMGYSQIPLSYQEAIYYVIGLSTTNPEQQSQFPISDLVKMRMRNYASIYTSYQDAQEMLKTNFSNTYWFYLHYR